MAKTVMQRARELADAMTKLQQAAERFSGQAKDQSYARIAASTELSDAAVGWTQTVQRTMKGES